LGFLGDVVCQVAVEKRVAADFDFKRCFAMTTFGAAYQGGICYMLYSYYRRILPVWAMKTPLREGLGSTFIDNFVHVPLLYTPVFFWLTGALRGFEQDEISKQMNGKYVESVKACWVMWVPLQMGNFSMVPPHLRVAVMQTGCLAWNVILGYLANAPF